MRASIYDPLNATRDPGVRPLPQGMRCQQAGFCEASGLHDHPAELNEEERAAPAVCALCGRILCDYCAAGVKIPVGILDQKPWFDLKGLSRDQRVECFTCTDCFKEEWTQ